MQADTGKKLFEVAGGLTVRGPDTFHTVGGTSELIAFRPIFVGASLAILDVETRKVLHQTPPGTGSIRAAAFAASGKALVTVDQAGKVLAWDPHAARELCTHQVAGQVTGVAVNRAGDYAAVIAKGAVEFLPLGSR